MTLSFFVSDLIASKESDKDEPEPNLYRIGMEFANSKLCLPLGRKLQEPQNFNKISIHILLCPLWFYFFFINLPSLKGSWKKAAVR
ncbi:MAG: hypothetical protein OXM55_01335 [Bdellovibrionales bacterium]|nr:hypothetical protein [Bdellovibrionales bacterium]